MGWTYKDAHVAPGEGYCGENRDDPVHPMPRRPREPEQADGDAQAASHGTIQPVLGCDVLLTSRNRLLVLLLVDEPIEYHRAQPAEKHAQPDTDEHQPVLVDIEVINSREDERKGAEEGEEEAEGEGSVQAEERDDGLSEEHAHRTQEGNDEEKLDRGKSLRTLLGRLDAKALRARL